MLLKIHWWLLFKGCKTTFPAFRMLVTTQDLASYFRLGDHYFDLGCQSYEAMDWFQKKNKQPQFSPPNWCVICQEILHWPEKENKKWEVLCFLSSSLIHILLGLVFTDKRWRQDSTMGMSTKRKTSPRNVDIKPLILDVPKISMSSNWEAKFLKTTHFCGSSKPKLFDHQLFTGIPQHTANKGRGLACTPDDLQIPKFPDSCWKDLWICLEI